MNLSRRDVCQSLVIGSAAIAGGPGMIRAEAADTGGASPDLAAPTPQQLAWQDLELGMFIHFDMYNYTGQMRPKTPPDPSIYNPTELDTDQWLETAKSMGAKYAVFVAKHGTGFLSWQSNAYPYGVKQSSWRDGKGDVVRDFVNSCHEYGIKPGVYANIAHTSWWGVEGHSVKWGDRDYKDYAKAVEVMLTELWSNYGELTEIWFDGGVRPFEKGGPNLVPIMQKHQPNAVVFQGPMPGGIRWIGNERGVAAYPCWSTVKKLNDRGAGNPDGRLWNPGECDVPLPGYGWFWQGKPGKGQPNEETQKKTLDRLMDMYYKSVGRNCNLLLNATPDTRGLIPEVTLPHYANFGKEVQRRFGKSVAESQGRGDTVELLLPAPTPIDHVILMEDIAHGERVREFKVEGLVPGGSWQPLTEGVSIGHKWISKFNSVEVAKIRFRATKSVAEPIIRRLAAFQVGAV